MLMGNGNGGIEYNRYMKTDDIYVSYFKDIYDVTGANFYKQNVAPIRALFECIKNGGRNGKIRYDIGELRKIQDKGLRNEKKCFLPVVTWQGVFRTRDDGGLINLSSLICIDIDHKTTDEIAVLKANLMTLGFVLAIFRSPSGDGIKVIVKTDLFQPEHYKNCYKQIELFFTQQIGVDPDNKCESLSQGCFLSYDPDIYINHCVADWHYLYDPTFDETKHGFRSVAPSLVTDISAGELFMNKLNSMRNNVSDEQIIRILDIKFHRFPQNYTDGHRTKSIFSQASILCKAGIGQKDAVDYLKSAFLPTGYNEKKLEYEANRAYQKCMNQFGTERGQYKQFKDYKL